MGVADFGIEPIVADLSQLRGLAVVEEWEYMAEADRWIVSACREAEPLVYSTAEIVAFITGVRAGRRRLGSTEQRRGTKSGPEDGPSPT